MAKNTFPIAEPRKLMRRILEEGDALGLEQDPELLVHLARGARERFLQEPSPEALRHWEELVAEYSEVSGQEDPGLHAWLTQSSVELIETSSWVASPPSAVVTRLDAKFGRSIAEDEREKIRERIRFMAQELAVKAGQ